MALGILYYMFLGLGIISVLLVCLVFLVKDKKLKNIVFYILVLWSVLITFFNVSSLPTNYVVQRIIGCCIGLIAVIAVFIRIKKPDKSTFAYILVSVSTVLGLSNLYF